MLLIHVLTDELEGVGPSTTHLESKSKNNYVMKSKNREQERRARTKSNKAELEPPFSQVV